MPPFSIHFEMTDTLIAQATREDCITVAREHIRLFDMLAIMASTAIFVRAVWLQSHWIWWIAGLPIVIYGILALGWCIAFLLLPRIAIKRLVHLPHRRVQVEMSDDHLSFQTAHERLEVTWDELKFLKHLPHFWLFCLRSGARIPVPQAVATQEMISVLESKLAINSNKPK